MNISRLTVLSLLFVSGISSVYAADASAASSSQQGGLLSFLPMILILVLFMYFMVIRPQSKRSKDHKNLMSSLKVGDEVITLGGMFGKIEKISDDSIVLSIADNVNILIQKNAVSHSVPKGSIKSAVK